MNKINLNKIDKETIKQVIIDFLEFIQHITVIPRNFNFEENANYVFTGIRRAGKSFLLYQRIHEMISKGTAWQEILYINFEDERLINLTAADLNLIIEAHFELFKTKPVLFLDEIQNISGWEKFARRMADMKYRVYITGSNAKMLSSEISTTLGGRFFIADIFPYSFEEFLLAKQKRKLLSKHLSTPEKGIFFNLFNEYFSYGGFPESLVYADKRGYLTSLYQKIYIGDICTRNNITNSFSLRVMIKKLSESTGQPISFNRLAHSISSAGIRIGTSTVINYLGYTKEARLIFSISNYAAKIAEKESNLKYYFADNGLLNMFLTDPETSLLENLAALTLVRRYGFEDSVFFYKKALELDFYIPKDDMAVQVCYSLQAVETQKREIKTLIKCGAYLQCKKFFIITKNEEQIIQKDNITIQVLPIWKFVLNK